jgi:hypothetical protein
MLDTSFLVLADKRLRQMYRPDLDFGGIDVLLAGDFVQLPVARGTDLYNTMYARHVNDDGGAAKILFAKFEIIRLRQQFRAVDQKHCDHLDTFRKLPTRYPTGVMWEKRDAQYKPMTQDLCNALTNEITPADIVVDTQWNTDSTILTATNSDRTTVNQVRVLQFAILHNQPAIRWRRTLRQTLPRFLENTIYNDKLFPEVFGYFTKNAPSMILDNGNGNVTYGVANGTPCKMISLSWDDEQDRKDAETIIAAHTDFTKVCELPIPPDHIIVSVPNVDVANWPKELNLAPKNENNKITDLHIPIGLHKRQAGVLKIKNLSFTYKRHACDLAFAITVHKAQGKTISHVIVLLDGDSSMLSYELLYVAFSRVHTSNMYRCFPLQIRAKTHAKMLKLRPRINAIRWRLDTRDGRWHRAAHIVRPANKARAKRA